jgi:undecaprenyl phosphate-alpha-L-ara4FN deformylase
MIALKLDIDTYRGLKEGLPKLLELFKSKNIHASVFVSFGPDNSGKAIKRVFTKRGFLKKMLKTKAKKLYGIKTMLYGTLLPAPQIGNSFPELLRQAQNEGHEMCVHAFNHVKWQDDLNKMSEEEIEHEISNAIKSYREIFKHPPHTFGAPGWQLNEKALKVLLKHKWNCFSNCRGNEPAYPQICCTKSHVLEIPTTLPTLDEILAWDNTPKYKALQVLSNLPVKGKLNVFTLHTEVEGQAYLDFFKTLLENWIDEGFKFSTLKGAMENLNPKLLPTKMLSEREIPGRSGTVMCI